MSDLEQMQALLKEIGDTYGLQCFLVFPDGRTYRYARLVDAGIMEEKNFKTMQFFSDDMMYAFLDALPDGQPEPSEDSGFQEEPDVYTSSPKGLYGSPNSFEDLGVAESTGDATNDNDVKDADD